GRRACRALAVRRLRRGRSAPRPHSEKRLPPHRPPEPQAGRWRAPDRRQGPWCRCDLRSIPRAPSRDDRSAEASKENSCADRSGRRAGRTATGARPGGFRSRPERLDGAEIAEGGLGPLVKPGSHCLLLPGNLAGEKDLIRDEPATICSLMIQHVQAELFLRRDVVELTQAVLDLLHRFLHSLPATFGFLA